MSMQDERVLTIAEAGTTAAWFAIRTAPRHEKRVHERLMGRSVDTFLPLWERWSRWKDRRTRIAVPLFPGYCFARFAAAERVGILKTAGVVGIVGTAGVPEAVDEREIRDLKMLVESHLEYDPHPGLQEGSAVEVTRGPLTGVRGVLVRKEPRCRLVILVNVIRQGAAVEIDAADVAPL
ncbi:MAG: UpxY family transcription antiterminator [Candidatus Rokubacteria bacterium]|nr:UpxY family transcription antiterminator [Candidatus Rokubacteria bacterium]